MSRFVVFHAFRGIMVWYVEAVDERAAVERVWPEDASHDPVFVDNGGMEEPHLEAHTGLGAAPWARRVRRFPRGVGVAFGLHEHRYTNLKGEP